MIYKLVLAKKEEIRKDPAKQAGEREVGGMIGRLVWN